MRLACEPARKDLAKDFLSFVSSLDPGVAEDEQTALEGARLFTRYLEATRAASPMATIGPGRFLMPGDLEGSPLLTFFPLPIKANGEPPRGSLGAMMARRFDSYVAHVVRPFFVTTSRGSTGRSCSSTCSALSTAARRRCPRWSVGSLQC